VPGAVAAPEHVAAHHRRADACLGLLDHPRAGVDLATLQAFLRAPGLEPEEPLVQLHAADTRRVFLALVGAGDVAVPATLPAGT
jgi:hypothetical protein